MKLRYLITGIVTITFVLACFPATVLATAVMESASSAILVNDEKFEIWGYIGDLDVQFFRLRDIAYILNGTSAQFDIRAPLIDGKWDFWIERGAPYTLTDAELSPITENRRALFGSYGFVKAQSYGLDENPIQNIMLGIDGDEIPAMSITLQVFNDTEDIFFPLRDLGYLLGFNIANSSYLSYGFHILLPTAASAPATNDNAATTTAILLLAFVSMSYILKARK